MRSLVIGIGEIGGALFRVLCNTYGLDNVYPFDIKEAKGDYPLKADYVHICFPYSDSFVDDVKHYAEKIKYKYLIIHSSVPVGTTAKIEGAFHSPIRGKHPDLDYGITNYDKYIGYPVDKYVDVVDVVDYFENAGIPCIPIVETKTTELMKLLALSRYGVYIAFAKEQEAICKQYGCSYNTVVTEVEESRNKKVDEKLKQPILYPFDKYIGGHCTVEDMELLLEQTDAPLLREAHKIGKGTTIWGNTNIYPSATIGKGCSIGQFCEIGRNVKIGNDVRIGAYTFIPEGVSVEDDVFIAPKVTFSNDKHPPAGREKWGKVLIKKGAVIGMGAIILPGVTVGERAVIGAGSIVTKDVAPGAVVYGQAAYQHGSREEVYNA